MQPSAAPPIVPPVRSMARRATEIRGDQRQWMKERESCTRERRIEQCLSTRYLARIGQLEPKR